MRTFEGYRKGVNLGGWISQFAEYDKAHFESFITERDIEYISGLGFDHVRVPVDYNVLQSESGEIIPEGFGYLESCLAWCRKYSLKMIIDLHECYGYSFDPLKKGMDRRIFFYDEALQERFLSLWDEIACRFGRYSAEVAFEPLNEVAPADVAEAWNALTERYIERVRRIAPDSWIIVGGVCYNHVTSVPKLAPPKDDRVVYNFHCYEPFVFTHQGAYWVENMPADFRTGYPKTLEEYRKECVEYMHDDSLAIFAEGTAEIGPGFFEQLFAPALAAAEKCNAPLYCGEYGTIDLAPNPDKLRWLKDIQSVFDKYGIGRALWNYKEKDFGLVDASFAEIRDAFIAL